LQPVRYYSTIDIKIETPTESMETPIAAESARDKSIGDWTQLQQINLFMIDLSHY